MGYTTSSLYMLQFHLTATYDLHVFCDASARCYATAVYLRVSDSSTTLCNLVFSKLRLAPAKVRLKDPHLTIPRLELLGVLIGVRAASFVQSELRVNISQTVVWTDSLCVLCWIKSAKKLSVFVGNRIKEIRSAENVTFRHVSSADNPADLPTRGRTVDQLRSESIWWHGPQWLSSDVTAWPDVHPSVTPEILAAVSREESSITLPTCPGEGSRMGDVHCMTVEAVATTPIQCILKSSSSLHRAINVLVLCLKFLRRMVWSKLSSSAQQSLRDQHVLLGSTFPKLSDSRSATPQDRSWATMVFIRHVQQEAYRQGAKQHLVGALGIVTDEFGLLRCTGRYANSALAPDAKRPLLLPRRSLLTDLLILDTHERLLHSGVAHTLAVLRTKYWVPQGRAVVRNVVSRCVQCKKLEGPPFKIPPMAPWPLERTIKSQPFQHTGVDNLGPFKVKALNGSVIKLWVCLFTCFASRAVHLEWMLGMSTSDFLQAFRRFVARRGHPSSVYSDNAPQFKLARDTLAYQWHALLSSNQVVSATPTVTWRFTTEYSPWEGGLYERLVGLTKRSLRKAIGRALLTVQKFVTILTEVEGVLNSRPLCYVDSESFDTISPAHLLNLNRSIGLVGPPNTLMNENDDDDDDDAYQPQVSPIDELQGRLKELDTTIGHFWKIWSREYLLSLRERPSKHAQRKNAKAMRPQLGELVIVSDKDQPRAMWKLARICKVHKSSDGFVRSADVLLPNKRTLHRSVCHLYPLEVRAPESSDIQSSRSDVSDGSDSADVSGSVESDASDAVNGSVSVLPSDVSVDDNSHIVDNSLQSTRPVRQAAANARARLVGILASDSDDSE